MSSGINNIIPLLRKITSVRHETMKSVTCWNCLCVMDWMTTLILVGTTIISELRQQVEGVEDLGMGTVVGCVNETRKFFHCGCVQITKPRWSFFLLVEIPFVINQFVLAVAAFVAFSGAIFDVLNVFVAFIRSNYLRKTTGNSSQPHEKDVDTKSNPDLPVRIRREGDTHFLGDISYKKNKGLSLIISCDGKIDLAHSKGKTVFRVAMAEVFAIHPLKDREGVLVCRFKLKKKKVVKYEFLCSKWKELLRFLQKMCFGAEKEIDNSQRKMLVIINPVSGKGKAKQSFQELVAPILDISHLTYTTIETTKAGHAKEIVIGLDLSKYNEIAAVGGDGTMFEIWQGLLNHKQLGVTRKIPIALFPCGSGNGLSMSCGSQNDIEIAAFIAARGKIVPCDMWSVFKDNKRYFCSLSLTFGLVADTGTCFLPQGVFLTISSSDVGTEKWKWIGDLRFIIGAMVCLIRNTFYRATLKVISDAEKNEPKRNTPYGPKPREFPNCYSVFETTKTEKKSESKERALFDCPFIKQHFMKELMEVAPNFEKEVSKSVSPVSREKYKTEEFIDEKFSQVTAVNVPYLSADFCFSPSNYVNSGWMDVILLRKRVNVIRRVIGFLRFFGNVLEAKDQVEGIRCKALYFKPGDEKKKSYLVFDGEKSKYSPSVIEIHPSLTRVFTL